MESGFHIVNMSNIVIGKGLKVALEASEVKQVGWAFP